MRLDLRFVVSIALALCAAAGEVQAQFDLLVQRVPQAANTLVLVNTEKALASPAAIRNDWRNRLQEAHAVGLTVIPPDSKCAIFASHLDFSLMMPLWEAAVVEMVDEPDFSAFAKRAGAAPDMAGPYEAFTLPSDATVVKFGATLFAAMAPANRQAVGRWVRETDTRQGPSLPPYLMEAYGYANNIGTPIIMAVDLQDVVQPELVQATLAEHEKFKDRADLAALAQSLGSIRGLTLGVTINETMFGKVKVDFEKPVALNPDEAKTILLAALKNHGVMLDELEEWTPKASAKQVTLEGEMTRSGLKRLFSLFSAPPAIKAPPTPAKDPSPGDYVVGPAVASQKYYKQISGFLTDLRRKKSGASTMGESAAFYETYARKIDQLSVLNVDTELVKFGAYASESLRAACGAMRGASATRAVREANVLPQYDTYTYGVTYGYTYRAGFAGASYTGSVYDAAATQQERTRVRTEERVAGYQKANQIMQELEQATANIRKTMTVKFKVDFPDM